MPLFAGIPYSSVGRYIARAWRLLEFRFTAYPPVGMTAVRAGLAYVNFFIHHFIADIGWIFIAASVVLFWRCRLTFRTGRRVRTIPLLAGLLTVAFLIWITEIAGTYARAWVYRDQIEGWKRVSLRIFRACYLLMILGFVLVSFVNPVRRPPISRAC